MEKIIEYHGIKMYDVPHAKEIMEEVIEHDCYRINDIPWMSRVVDIGGFYGEFGMMCAMKQNCKVAMFEPNSANRKIAERNIKLNQLKIELYPEAISDSDGKVAFFENKGHPGGSRIISRPSKNWIVSLDINCLIKDTKRLWTNHGQKITVKIDAEGSEVKMFKKTDWLQHVDYVTMEWHNFDGHVYRNILKEYGFEVELEGAGPPPRPRYSNLIAAGLLHAKKK